MKFIDFHKDKRGMISLIDTFDIKDNEYLSEMFKTYYDFKKYKGCLKSFFYHNRTKYDDIPDNFKKMQIYDPDLRVDFMLENRRRLIEDYLSSKNDKNQKMKLIFTGRNGNKIDIENPDNQISNSIQNKRQILNKNLTITKKIKYSMDYSEQIDEFFSNFHRFEEREKAQLTRIVEEQPNTNSSARIEMNDSSQFKFKCVLPPKTEKISGKDLAISLNNNTIVFSQKPKDLNSRGSTSHQITEETLKNESQSTLMQLMETEFRKNLTFGQRSMTEDFIYETRKQISSGRIDSTIPLYDFEYKSFFELCQMEDSKVLILYSIADDGVLNNCEKFADLNDFDLPIELKYSPFRLYLIYQAFLLFENNWSFIYNILLKNAFLENVRIDFSKIISGVNLSKFMLGDKFFESTKKPNCDALTRQLFKLLNKASKKQLLQTIEFPKRKLNIIEFDHFNCDKAFYFEDSNREFGKEDYYNEYCKSEIELKINNSQISDVKFEKKEFPVPEIKKNFKIEEEIQIPRNIKNNTKERFIEMEGLCEYKENRFERFKNGEELFDLFNKKVKESGRIHYEKYKKISSKQMFCYKLKKFKSYKEKKFGRVRNMMKKSKNYEGNTLCLLIKTIIKFLI